MSRWDPDAKGRLAEAARTLFIEQGFDRTTVADIATRAGLTERTFFRHFTDKREVLFAGDMLSGRMSDVVASAPSDLAPIEVVTLAVEDACDAITSSPDWSRDRARIVAEHADLRERELAKMGVLAAALAEGLRARDVPASTAVVAAELGVLAFRLAYERWAVGPRSERLAPMVRVVLAELADVAGHR
ncbi:TetR/AcrR family transcriptional regulator [Aeromicrobium sp. CFBP 8757]|uniref:TetR/AcrR family transcriptional regulator n=1 Tax=Aeromicrobium sp. CFBP 8757 TaxID=2775288 RepID=UPI00177E8152|nr:TetR/AcrR family transcriptional regulator [Aeromicrobium sp. CFBP 8757]MBD8608552.1 TetR/AcrR family transcriptional regulator [Aeromicrobium sp. CFBP 8757]